MISLGPKYLDYGLTGGFFLFLALALFVGFDIANATAALTALREYHSKNELKELETLVNGVLASLFVVCVFATGLILDLTGSILILWEADVFRRYLERNKRWIEPLLSKYQGYLREDLCQFLTIPPFIPRNWNDVKGQFFFRGFRLLPQMRRIESVLLAHLLFAAEREKLEFVLDQFRICRLARAVSSGTYILTLGFYFYALHLSSTKWAISLLLAATILSTFIVRRAYSKLCSNLFSTLLVLAEQKSFTSKIEKDEGDRADRLSVLASSETAHKS